MAWRDGLRAPSAFLQSRICFKKSLVHEDERIEHNFSVQKWFCWLAFLLFLQVRNHQRQEFRG